MTTLVLKEKKKMQVLPLNSQQTCLSSCFFFFFFDRAYASVERQLHYVAQPYKRTVVAILTLADSHEGLILNHIMESAILPLY